MYWGRQEDEGRERREGGRGWTRSEAGRDWRNEGERDWERERREWGREPRDLGRQDTGEQRDWQREARDWWSRATGERDAGRERDWQRPRRRFQEGGPGPESWQRGPHAGAGRECREQEWRPPGYAQADSGREGYGSPGAWREQRREPWHRERGGEDWGGGWSGWMHEQSFRNRAPKGYKRSDKRIMEDVCDEFMIDDHLDPSEIEVEVLEGIVILRGTVNQRHEKYLAEDLAESVLGVKDVDNRLRVLRTFEAAQRDRGERAERPHETAERTAQPAEATSKPPEAT
jgi:hypothetical protein